MAKKPIFGLDPEKLDRLLSIGTDGVDEFDPENKKLQSSGDIASSKKSEAPSLATSLDRFVEQPGNRIGRYRLLSVLGEGGMGIVYLAGQTQPIKRQVALKIIKLGLDTKNVIARFEAERQALALLDHPNIAHIHDAGTTESGRPYFVMEYVQGLPITEYCDLQKLTIEGRLNLFLQVCHAVHHAHQKGIIHRDIKPSNILISISDDQAVPKIIDFGVAKAINQPLTEKTLFTEQGQLFGTPEYMSPEQADMANEDIDTRSDIYSLGVLLYVLLTGVLPFDSDTFRQGGIEHIRRVIRETEPKTPSTRLKSLGQEARKVAESRRIELVFLTRCLHRELEWIPLKAMCKEPSERYRSASELADDVENYLHGAPLIAGPPKTVYKLKKFIRRNRALVTGVVAVLVVLVAGIVVSMLFAIGQARSRAKAQAISDFFQNIVLASLDPFKVGGREITIRSAWDAASENIEEKFTNMPLVEAGIRYTVGNAYWSLGLYKQAELHLRRALEIQQDKLGNENPATLSSAHYLGWLYFSMSRYNQAEQLLTQALETRRRVLGEENVDTLSSMVALACVYNMQGRFQEAEELIEKALEVTQRVLGEKDPYMPAFMNAMAWCYELQGRYKEAEHIVEQGLEVSRQVRGENDWFTLVLKHTYARTSMALGHYDQAEKFLNEALVSRSEVWGKDHPDTLETMADLGWLYLIQGRYEEAESVFVEVLDTARQVLGEAHLCSLHAMYGLGTLRLSQSLYDRAEELLLKVLEIAPGVVGEEHLGTLSTKSTLAKLYTVQGRYEEAEELYLKTLNAQNRVLGHQHPYTLASINGLAVLRTKQKQYEEAERLFHEALEGRKLKLGDDHPETLESKNDLAMLYKEQGDYDKAEPLLLEAVKGRRLKLGDTHPHTLESWHNLISLYEAWNKPEEAKKWRAKLPES